VSSITRGSVSVLDGNLRSLNLGMWSGIAANSQATSPVPAIRRPKKSATTVRAGARSRRASEGSSRCAYADRAAGIWCENTTLLTDVPWLYLKVLQTEFGKLQGTDLSDLQLAFSLKTTGFPGQGLYWSRSLVTALAERLTYVND
jgi:hypothetical protein